MAKFTVISYLGDGKYKCDAYKVYVNDVFQGVFSVYENAVFDLNASCRLRIEVGEYKSHDINIDGEHECSVGMRYDEVYDTVMFYLISGGNTVRCAGEKKETKVPPQKSEGVKTDNSSKASYTSHSAWSNTAKRKSFTYDAFEREEPIIKRIFEEGRWVTVVFGMMEILLLLGGFITAMGVSIAEDTLMGFWVFLGTISAALALIFDFCVAGYFYFAARDKGYTDLFYFACAFLVPFAGYLLVIALPDKNKSDREK